MTTLAQMRSEVARDHNWHEDDDGDRIDEVLNERFGQAAVEMYAALETIAWAVHSGVVSIVGEPTSRLLDDWLAETDAALSKARAQ